MRHVLTLSAVISVVGFATVATPAHAAIALNNPGFETPASGNPDSWGIGGTDLADVSTDVFLSGAQSLKFTAPGNGQQTDAFNPNFTGAGDSTTPLTLSVWVYTPSSAPLADTFFVLGIEFKKTLPGGGDTFVDGGELVFSPESLAQNTWQQLSFTKTASGPWDVLIFHLKTVGATANAAGLLYADDVSAAVPEPAALSLLGVGMLAAVRWRRSI